MASLLEQIFFTVQFLLRFNFVIQYRPGKLNAKPNALIKRSGDLPKRKKDEHIQQIMQTVLKPHNVDAAVKTELNVDNSNSKVRDFESQLLNLSFKMLGSRADYLADPPVNFMPAADLMHKDDQAYKFIPTQKQKDNMTLEDLLNQGYSVDLILN